MLYIVAGVSGSGKSTIGILLAERLGMPFHDGDDFHPQSNKDKMNSGKPLDDNDRLPWLETLNENLKKWGQSGGAVLACSALKESYRHILSREIETPFTWVFLKGTKELLQKRMEARSGHFFNPALLDSQLETIHYPTYGLITDIEPSPEQIVTNIMENTLADIGLIGLGVMGGSLALNIADKGFTISVFNRSSEGEENMVSDFMKKVEPHQKVRGYTSLTDFVKSMKKPASILVMVKAGEAVDSVIDSLLPLLEKGDLIVDCGNSHFEDTKRRNAYLAGKGLNYLGTGVSGGEKGARFGPSIMPGGEAASYSMVQPVLEKISAKDEQGNPCCNFIGPEGSGHFVKMIHNGIEYAEMQILAETYFIMGKGLGMDNEAMARELERWKDAGMGSYLLEITVDILRKKEGNGYLLDCILDKAGQKGTGSWSSEFAFKTGVPLNTISEAVIARQVSAIKAERERLEGIYGDLRDGELTLLVSDIQKAVALASVINHHIGFHIIEETSKDRGWSVNLSETARIWTNGCIIRSELMKKLCRIFMDTNEIIEHPEIIVMVKRNLVSLRKVVAACAMHGLPVPVLSTALQYLTSVTQGRLSANLIQAQRDYFGAHTYQRTDDSEGRYFHTEW